MLKRDISSTNVLIAAAGGMIGSGWLFSPFISAQIAGSNALISWIIAAIFMVFVALPLCELGAMLPVSGGMTNYPTYTHGKQVGFIFAWISWLSYVVMTPIEIQAILQYGSHVFPALTVKNQGISTLSSLGYAAAFIIMLAVTLINTFGVKLLAECNKYASLIKFLIPSIAIVSLLNSAPSFSNIQLNLSDAKSWEAIFSALSIGGVVFAFTGFQNGLMLAGEVKNPQRNLPIAILGAVAIGFILYFFLQLAFLAAVPKAYIANGWQHLNFPGASGPLVGLALLLGLSTVAILLMFDASFSPFGTTLVYTAATSRILYGMALNKHLPAFLLKENRYQIPYITLLINFIVGILSFLPFPGWQKMVAFLSSTSILSYGIGPICLLGLRKLQPNTPRPFRLSGGLFLSHVAFYVCNLMLYWCGFSTLWKLYIAVIIGLMIKLIYERKNIFNSASNNMANGFSEKSVSWFFLYLTTLLLLSYVGPFGGIGIVKFPYDIIFILPFSILMLFLSQRCLVSEENMSFSLQPCK
jgi:amino acid transporter